INIPSHFNIDMFAIPVVRSTALRIVSEAPKLAAFGVGILGVGWYGNKVIRGQEVLYINFKKQTA
ncbi:hypothetical protein K493DRAFT_317294, partial [Basidiobolus meristosporus CBS 931.73]